MDDHFCQEFKKVAIFKLHSRLNIRAPILLYKVSYPIFGWQTMNNIDITSFLKNRDNANLSLSFLMRHIKHAYCVYFKLRRRQMDEDVKQGLSDMAKTGSFAYNIGTW